MRKIFSADTHERSYREQGYVVIDLLEQRAITELWSFFDDAFPSKRAVVDYAQQLPYYISVFDKDVAHKRKVDELISRHVGEKLAPVMIDYNVFYSNFMIKFPGDGQIEAHQDFNFVDESQHAAFNLWCPLIDTTIQNGGLFVIPGSHNVFRTQRGPNLPKALTEYNELFRKYGRWIPLNQGQAIIFDHRLIHYSPPNQSDQVRLAIQSVLKPQEAQAIHYVFHPPTGKVQAYRISKDFVLESNLWESNLSQLTMDHEQDLVPFLSAEETVRKLSDLRLRDARRHKRTRKVFREEGAQREFEENGFVKLSVLGQEEVQQLLDLFRQSTGGQVVNSEYGIYIGIEEKNLERKKALIRNISAIALSKVNEHFVDCKPHLGSFLVKSPGEESYTYPHQDWTFVDPPNVSVTVWIALVDTDESNGALGFVRGSQIFFDKLVGSPSPEFQTCTQGHEALLYEFLTFVPLKAGEAVAFDNRTIHGATANRSQALRTAVAIGMTPHDAELYHYYVAPGSLVGGRRKIARLKVNEAFFERYPLGELKSLFQENRMPDDCQVEAVLEEEFIPFSVGEVRTLCEQAGLARNGQRLERRQAAGQGGGVAAFIASRLLTAAGRVRKAFARG
jgi:ectoine hydroxylase-related dioxygenase (phytanoyl-CoA dioxygenase family)